jgi:hypothetical protein
VGLVRGEVACGLVRTIGHAPTHESTCVVLRPTFDTLTCVSHRVTPPNYLDDEVRLWIRKDISGSEWVGRFRLGALPQLCGPNKAEAAVRSTVPFAKASHP